MRDLGFCPLGSSYLLPSGSVDSVLDRILPKLEEVFNKVCSTQQEFLVPAIAACKESRLKKDAMDISIYMESVLAAGTIDASETCALIVMDYHRFFKLFARSMYAESVLLALSVSVLEVGDHTYGYAATS